MITEKQRKALSAAGKMGGDKIFKERGPKWFSEIAKKRQDKIRAERRAEATT